MVYKNCGNCKNRNNHSCSNLFCRSNHLDCTNNDYKNWEAIVVKKVLTLTLEEIAEVLTARFPHQHENCENFRFKKLFMDSLVEKANKC